MANWNEHRIGDLGRVITGKTPSTKKPEYFGGKYPFVTIPDLGRSVYVHRTERTISDVGAKVLRSCRLPKNSVMMSCIATIGKCGITATESFTNQQINSVICDEEIVAPLFLYYIFTGLSHELQRAGGGGSVYTNVSKSRFSDIIVKLPLLPEQKRIAEILGSLDDKIELNRRMNETLEGMARAVFVSWFVDFDPVIDNALAAGNPIPAELAEKAARRKHYKNKTPLPKDIQTLFPDRFEPSPLGPIPKGWKVVTFEKFVSAKQGKYLANKEIADNPTDEYVYPVWGGNGIRGYSSDFMYENPVVVLTCRGSNCGLINLTKSNVWVSNIAFACTPKYGSIEFLYIYFLLSSFEDCISGSAQPQITYTALKDKIMPFPLSNDVCDVYSLQIASMYQKIKQNELEIKTLTHLRDSLLPKLISGEIRVKDAERFLEEKGL